jgi:hypothetical protein
VRREQYSETGGEEKYGEFKCQLFSGGVTPSDIAQGQLGAPSPESCCTR